MALNEEIEAKSDAERDKDEKIARGYAAEFWAPGALGRAGPQLVPNAQEVITKRTDAANKAMGEDKALKAIYDKHKSGLEGYSAAENQAIREQGVSQIKKDEANALRSFQRFASKNGVTGESVGGAGMGILRAGQAARGQNETDLIAKNVAEKRQRLNDYSEFYNESEDRRGKHQNETLKGLADDVFNQQKYSTELDIYNLAQAEKERQNYIGTFFGVQGLLSGHRAGNEQLQYSDEMLDITKNQKLYGGA